LRLTSARDLERRAQAWRPWRAYAAIRLWNIASRSGTSDLPKSEPSSPIDFAMVATST
jgi:3-methyladenine DNA glycosylase/8-oxoguanine DNA glycosylase